MSEIDTAPQGETKEQPFPTGPSRFAVHFDPNVTIGELVEACANVGVHLYADKDGRWVADRMHIFALVKKDPIAS